MPAEKALLTMGVTLQGRGQEAFGLAVFDGTSLQRFRALGLVPDTLPDEDARRLTGTVGIGHVRYSTTGESRIENAHPRMTTCSLGTIAVAHNGNLNNTKWLRRRLLGQGVELRTDSDTELILHAIATAEGDTIEARVAAATQLFEGCFNLLVLSERTMVVVKDPNDFRPLAIGQLENAWVVASETTAFGPLGVTSYRELGRGEMVVIRDGQSTSKMLDLPPRPRTPCVFELIYLSWVGSDVWGVNVDAFRQRLGIIAAREASIEVDDNTIVVAVPDSGRSSAIGVAEGLGVPIRRGLVKRAYVGRTFNYPKQVTREEKVRLKFEALRHHIEGRRVILVDDSIVRGTTMKPVADLVREAGAAEVHVIIACPEIKHACHLGVDMKTPEELVANKIPDMKARAMALGVESIHHLSLLALLQAAREELKSQVCHECFSGQKPYMPPVR